MRKRKPEALMSEIKKGDIVALRPEHLKKRPKKGTFTPADLLGVGWPNEFYVLKVGKGPEGEAILTLDPCCLQMVADNGDLLCKAHPADRFVVATPAKKGNGSSIRQPGAELFKVEYSEEDEPCLEIQVFGEEPLIFGGAFAKKVGRKFRDAGIA